MNHSSPGITPRDKPDPTVEPESGHVLTPRFRSRAARTWELLTSNRSLNTLIPVILGLLPLIWLLPHGNYLYGEDSLTLIQPFNANFNPLQQYNYLFSQTFPLPDEQPYFFTDVLLFLGGRLGASPVVMERIFLLLLTIVGNLGLFRLLSVLNRVNGLDPSSGILAKTLSTVFFVMNPYTLSVSWWHFENWNYMLSATPFLLSALIELAYLKKLELRRFASLLVVFGLLAPGLNGPFVPGVAYTVGFFSLFALVDSLKSERLRLSSFRIPLSMISIGLVAIGASFLPYLAVPNLQLTNTGYVNAGNLVQQFQLQTQSDSILNVMSLTAFVWIRAVPDAYPWSWMTTPILLAAILLLLPLIVVLLRAPQIRGMLPLYLWIFPIIVVSTGSTAPFGGLNLFLLKLRGPFLIVDNGYDALAGYLVAFYAVVIYVLLSRLYGRPNPKTSRYEGTSATITPRGPSRHLPALRSLHSRWPGQESRYTRILRLLGIVGFGICMIVVVIPFASQQVYQTNGENIGSFPIPPSFNELESYFKTNYTGPFYNVLVLPMSSGQGMYLRFPDGGFTDSSYLIADYIPYPIIATNTGSIAEALDSLIVGGTAQSLLLPLVSLHIRYVVVNPYFNPQSYDMTHDSGGHLDNLSRDIQDLTGLLGTPTRVDGFLVFECPLATPFLDAQSALPVLAESSIAGYLGAIAGVTSTNSTIFDLLSHSSWSPTLIPSSDQVNLLSVPIGGFQGTVPTSGGFALLNETGAQIESGTGLTGVVFNSTTRNLSVQPTLRSEFTPNNTSSVNFEVVNGSFTSLLDQGATLTLNSSIQGSSIIESHVNILKTAPSSWIDIEVSDSNASLWAQYHIDVINNASSLALYMQGASGRFTWSVTNPVPTEVGNQFSLDLVVGRSAASSEILLDNGTSEGRVYLHYGTLNSLKENEGYNLSAIPPDFGMMASYVPAFVMSYASVSLNRPAVLNPSPVGSLLMYDQLPDHLDLPATFSVSATGDYKLNIRNATGQLYVVLGLPYSALWNAGAPGHTFVHDGVAPESNVFVGQLGSSRYSELTIQIHFSVYLDQGLSVLISGTIVGAGIWLMCVVKRARCKS